MPAGDPVNDADPTPGSRKSLRIAGFANFFKSYMSVSAIIAAAVPIPVAALKLIPTYEQQRGYLSVYASLFCFLLVAFVFSIRHALAVRMFSRGLQSALIAALPAVFILLTAVSIADYHLTLQHSLAQWRSVGVTAPSSELLSKADYMEIPYSLRLTLCYLGIFVFAEAAFVLMAMREYLQDILHLDEVKLAQGRRATTHVAVASSSSSSPIEHRAKSPAHRRGG
jgi:hypothetical protein